MATPKTVQATRTCPGSHEELLALADGLRARGVTRVTFDAQGNLLELCFGPPPEAEQEKEEPLSPEQLKADAERILYAASEGFGA